MGRWIEWVGGWIGWVARWIMWMGGGGIVWVGGTVWVGGGWMDSVDECVDGWIDRVGR